MRKDFFTNAEYNDKHHYRLHSNKYHSGGFMDKIMDFIPNAKEFIKNNPGLMEAGTSAVTSIKDAVMNIKDAAKNDNTDYRKSDRELIEEMKTENILDELEELDRLYSDVDDPEKPKSLTESRSGEGFKII
jgi:hypothetical protein